MLASCWMWHVRHWSQRTAREKGNSDDKAAAEAEAAQVEAESWIARAQEAERKANNPWENDGDEGGPKAFNAVFKADGFGMLEAMSQVRAASSDTTVRSLFEVHGYMISPSSHGSSYTR